MPVSGRKIFFGWHIVGVVFFAHFMAVGTGFYAINAFMEPLCELRGWTRTDINMALVIGTSFGLLSQLVYGTLVMKTGARILMVFGSLLAGISFIFMITSESLLQFYGFYILLYMGNGAYGGIVANTAVNNWFIMKRGKAMGIATAGISVSGAVIPLLAMVLINKAGLSFTAVFIGVMIMFIAPFAWLFVKNWPEDYGMAPDGMPLPAPAIKAKNSDRGIIKEENPWILKVLLKTGAFWRVGFSFAFIMLGVVGVVSQLKPRFVEIGFNDMTAMLLLAIVALLGAAGKYVWGIFCDRYGACRVVGILSAANGLSLLLALFHNSIAALVLFIIIFGFTMGGVMSTYPIVVADLFGRRSFAAVLRFTSLFLILQVAGYMIAGQSFDLTGSYDTAYAIFVVFDFIAAVLLFSIKRPVLT
ncbi:MAG: MFS transporter [Desulfobacterales bacterium]|nr:MFS transporter [Desulfobacterales bacterium]